ncbi:hypothetical protein ACFQ2B_38045 [Streptomyces stramineus]
MREFIRRWFEWMRALLAPAPVEPPHPRPNRPVRPTHPSHPTTNPAPPPRRARLGHGPRDQHEDQLQAPGVHLPHPSRKAAPAKGTYVVDTRHDRVGEVMGHEGPRLQLRPPAAAGSGKHTPT